MACKWISVPPTMAFANEAKLGQNFATGAGCIFHLIFLTRLHLTTRGPQRFNLSLRPPPQSCQFTPRGPPRQSRPETWSHRDRLARQEAAAPEYRRTPSWDFP